MQDILHAFPGQDANEPVYVFARPDPIAFLPTLLVFLFVIAFAVIFELSLMSGRLLSLAPYNINVSIAVLGIFQLLALTVFFASLLDFYADVLIVTGKRLVLISQNQLLDRQISELGLEEIEDVSSAVTGLFPNLFNYGGVLIQTAGAEDKFHMMNLRYPREITALILNISEHAKKGLPTEPDSQATGGLVGVINSVPIHTIAELQQVEASENPTADSGVAQ